MSWLREPDTEPIPGYRLIEPLGSGGFGEVWKCEAPGGIHKAIKFVYGNLNSLEGDAVKAEQEWKALQKVKEVRHPFVLQLDRIEQVDGEVLIVMELADRSLHEYLEEAREAGLPGVPRDLLLRFLHDAAEGLDYLIERHNLLHLDVKPRNLFVVADRVKVADFGLVKNVERQSSSGLMGGISPYYAAPETFAAKICKHSDQYSLGVVYAELLLGRRPFTGKNIRQLALQHMNAEPDLDGMPEADAEVVRRALAKNPDERFPNCLAFIRTLAGLPTESNQGGRSMWSVSLGDFQLPAGPAARPAPAPPRAPVPKAETDATGGTQEEEVRLEQTDLPDLSFSQSQSMPPPRTRETDKSLVEGVLRPTVLIGVGSFGRRSLLEIRCRLLDRFGDLGQVPVYRFLYLDSDPEAAGKAMNVSSDIALTGDQFLPMPLQPASNYRRKQLEDLAEWLPTQKLYGMPRSLQPMESRALGRLAFCDHYLRFIARLRKELQVATHPEALTVSAAQTGLPARSSTPRVLLFADAVAGSGGAVMDIGAAVRDLIERRHHGKGDVSAFLFCGAPDDPATPAAERANLYATLTELRHYADPDAVFHADYAGHGGTALSCRDFPYESAYLVPLPDRSPEALRDAVAHLSTYVANELTSTLCGELQAGRGGRREDVTPFKSFGTYSVWFPRGLLLREAARQMGERLVGDWQSTSTWMGEAPVESACADALSGPELRSDAIRRRLHEATMRHSDGPPADLARGLITELEEESVAAAQVDGSSWARQALDRIQEVVGLRGGPESEQLYGRSRAQRVWQRAVQHTGEEIESRLTARAMSLLSYPGARLAAGESALRRMNQFFEEVLTSVGRKAHELSLRAQKDRAEVQAALDAFPGMGGFRLFSGSGARAVRTFMEKVRQFVKTRLGEDLEQAVVSFHRDLYARVEERLGDLSFCRQRLSHLQQAFGQPLGPVYAGVNPFQPASERSDISPLAIVDPLREALRGAATLKVVLPKGEQDVETSAAAFIQRLGKDHWCGLERAIESLVLAPMGGLFEVCMKCSDLVQHLAGPMIEQTAAYLGELLPVSDVAQVTFSAAQAQGVELGEQLRQFRDAAAPPLASPAGGERLYLLVPSSDAGRLLAEHAEDALAGVLAVPANASTTDLVVLRERDFMRPAELDALLEPCRQAYDDTAHNPVTSPHSRFDVREWIPLEE